MAIADQSVLNWLDDQNGPAKLTLKQREIIASLEREPSEQNEHNPTLLDQPTICLDSDNKTTAAASTTTTTTTNRTSHSDNHMIRLLKCTWKPNDIIEMFYDELEDIIHRGNECKNLLTAADSTLCDVLSLKSLYECVAHKASPLYSECKDVIHERNDLQDLYNRIKYTLDKEEELKNVFERFPDMKSHIFSILLNEREFNFSIMSGGDKIELKGQADGQISIKSGRNQ